MFYYVGIVDSPQDSIFTYQPGQTWATFYDPHFVPVYKPTFSSPSLQEQAASICGNDVECLFDMAATGREDIGIVSIDVEQEIKELLELQIPGIRFQ